MQIPYPKRCTPEIYSWGMKKKKKSGAFLEVHNSITLLLLFVFSMLPSYFSRSFSVAPLSKLSLSLFVTFLGRGGRGESFYGSFTFTTK